jgi:hypothetical protein
MYYNMQAIVQIVFFKSYFLSRSHSSRGRALVNPIDFFIKSYKIFTIDKTKVIVTSQKYLFNEVCLVFFLKG